MSLHGSRGIVLAHTLVPTTGLWFAFPHCSLFAHPRDSASSLVFQAPTHPRIEAEPLGVSSASFTCPLTKATTTASPHVLANSLPIEPFAPRGPALRGKTKLFLELSEVDTWTENLLLLFSFLFPFVVHWHRRVNAPLLFNTYRDFFYTLFTCLLFMSFLRWCFIVSFPKTTVANRLQRETCIISSVKVTFNHQEKK